MSTIKLSLNGVTVEVSKEDFSGALETGTLELNSELVVKTKEDFETLEKNYEREKAERYNNGKEKGEKDAVNKYAEKLGIDLEGKAKTLENLIPAFEEKISAKIGKPANEQIESLTKDNELLRGAKTEIENQFMQFKSTVEQQKKDSSINTEITNTLNKLKGDAKLTISEDRIATIFRLENKPTYSDEYGRPVYVDENGEVLKDSNRNPMTTEQVMSGFINQFITNPTKGATPQGGSNTHVGTMESFIKEMNDKGVNPNSIDFQQEMMQRIENKTLQI